jgi:peptidoglycan hydrolase-like protein with peptidoglycan-binding domain
MTKELTLNKFAAALVGLAMVAGLASAVAVERAHAQSLTLSDLVELFIGLGIITEDKAEDARTAVEGMGTTAPAATTPSLSTTMSCSFTRNLTTGATGQDVMDLQKLLNAKGFTVAVAGAGSPGMETSYYGPATAGAVKKMQEAFASEILAPLGLTAGTGFFGASTRAKANALCTAAPTTPTVPTLPEDDEDAIEDDEDRPTMSKNEADIDGNYEVLSTPSNEELEEGDTEAEVLGVKFEVEDGDVVVNRVDVKFKSLDTVKEIYPWRSLENVSLWYDGEEVATLDASRSSAWSRTGTNEYRIRFTNLDLPFYEGDEPEFVVAVDVREVIDSAKLDQEWQVWVPAQGVRARDGAGLDQYTGSNGELETFSIKEVGADGTLKVRLDSATPKASTIKVSTSGNTNNVKVLVFEIEADDAELTLQDLKFAVDTTLVNDIAVGKAYSDVINSFKVTIGSQTFTAKSSEVSTSTASTTDVTIDLVERNREITLKKDEKVKVTVELDLKRQSSGTYASGQSVLVSLASASDITAELSNGIAITTKSGSAVGERHKMLSEGVYAEIESTSGTVRTISNGTEDVVDFVMKFDLTAFDNTFYVGSTSASVMYTVERDGVAITGSTTSAILESNATEESNGNFRLDDGSTKTFTFSVTVNPDLTGAYRVVINGIKYSATNDGAVNDLTHFASPVSDFRSPSRSVTQ